VIEYRAYASPSGWNAISEIKAGYTTLQADAVADYLVVGAGFAGLAAARRLAELHPSERIVLLDAGLPGENSSGRNSGFMITQPYAKISASRDAAQREWQIRLLSHGKQQLHTIVQEHTIACGWGEIGHYKAATTPVGARALGALRQTLADNKVPFRVLDARDIASELGTGYYQAALWLPSCALAQPAELVNGLIEVLPANVSAYFDTPVQNIRGSGPYVVETGGGTVSARTLLLCVNSQLPEFGHAGFRQLTMYTYAGLTRPLSTAEAAQFGRDADWGLTPVERLEATSRKVGGKRYMLRTGFSYKRELPPEQVACLLARALAARHPDLPADIFEHIWGGAVSLTRNDAPILRQVGGRAFVLSGCNASGILKMSALGELLADMAVDRASPLLAETLALSKPAFIPPDPLRRIAVNMNLRKFKRELTGSHA